MRRLATLLLTLPAIALAQVPRADSDAPLAIATPQASLWPRQGATLPLSAAFTDSQARPLHLAAALAGTTPTLLAVGYDHCPQLCGLVLQGALEAGHATGLPGDAYRLLFVSIDPRDTPADAAARVRSERGYARFVAGTGAAPQVEALVGPPASIAALTQSLGYRYAAAPDDDAVARFAHPAALFVLTTDGRLVRTLGGVRFDADALRTALLDATAGRLEPDTPRGIVGRLALLCAHLDLGQGRWSDKVMLALRGIGLLTLLALAVLAWRSRREEPR